MIYMKYPGQVVEKKEAGFLPHLFSFLQASKGAGNH